MLTIAALTISAPLAAKKKPKSNDAGLEKDTAAKSVLWSSPDIHSRNLFYGAGGEAHAPHGSVAFEKEDKAGTSPKFDVHDADGVKWKAKLGHEARPETVATRFVWAVGYSTDEDYFTPELHVEAMPNHIRGQQYVNPPGVAHDVRLKRYLKGEKKGGVWKWDDNPFSHTQELNGLRVIMALINNWDTKNSNNEILREHGYGAGDPREDVYVVKDLGASFGSTGVTWQRAGTDGNLEAYRRSKFISKVTPSYVDFATPSRPFFMDVFYPPDFFMRIHMRWMGKRIPRADVHWVGQLLVQLSPEQIRDAFRAGGYSPEEVEGFSKIVEDRISQLSKL